MTKRGTLLFAISLFVSLGCDSAPDEQIAVEKQPHLLSQNVADVEDEENEDEEGDRVVELQWIDMENVEERTGLEVLVLKAVNPKPFSITVTADVECSGFINRKGTMPLVPHTQRILPGDEAFFEIEVDKLPVQNIEGASLLTASVKVKGDSSAANREWEVRTAPFYYRHDSGFKSLSAFKESVLLNKYGGIIAGSAAESQDTRVVGRVLDSKNQVSEIREVDVSAPVYDKKGRLRGTISGESIEIGIDPPTPELIQQSTAMSSAEDSGNDADLPERREE
jgi:hypothetical protein